MYMLKHIQNKYAFNFDMYWIEEKRKSPNIIMNTV